MRKTFVLLLTLLASLSAHANEGLTEIQDIALNFIRKHKSSIAASDLIQVSLADSMGFFAYNIANNNGFVLISKYGTNAVLGYSTTGHFSWEELPNNAAKWISIYNHTISEEKAANQLKATPSNNLKTAVEPLCEAKWWQSSFYSNQCPVDLNGDTTVTGCVATAMGIIMKRWNYPSQGTGSITYNDAKCGTVTGNFEESTYHWQDMPITLTQENTPEQIDAVASLLADCAKAIKSSFGSRNSGTEGRVIVTKNHPTENAEYAFPTYFGYDKNTIKGVIRSRYTNKNWKNLIKTELSEGRPVIYNGTSETATVGHCFVCDGYDKDDFFHFNWGWDGDLNGYFSIDSMIPYPGYDYSYNQEALIGIVPPSSYFDNTTTEQLPSNYHIQVYTNPTSGELNIELPDYINNIYLYLVNAKGARIKTIRNTDSIKLLNLEKGIYFLTGTINGMPITEKVEIQ